MKNSLKVGYIVGSVAFLAVLIGAAVGITLLVVKPKSIEVYTFPVTFKFGAASASYQIEGGWNEDGKSPSIWDTFSHIPGYIKDGSSGDVAADSYHMYEKDIEALDNIGFEVYRFSIAWTRIIPDGTRVNMKGIEYYNKLIDGLIAKGIEPLVTIYHWDLPQYIQDLGGWTNPLVVKYFTEYSDVLFEYFGDRVKSWLTVNEPGVFCAKGYGYGTKPPAIESPGVGDYLCVYHVLLANAAAYRLYKEKYSSQNGKVGICLGAEYAFKFDDSVPDSVVEKAIEFELGKFTNPIFSKEGGWPQVMINIVDAKSEKEGRSWSRLPIMSEKDKKNILGSADFLAINYYTSNLRLELYDDPLNPMTPSWWSDTGVDARIDPKWKEATSPWIHDVPEGLYELLVWIKNTYDNPTVMITENGWSDEGQLDDDDRVEYIKGHLAAISRAIDNEKCNVVAYTVWSLIDNFEWKEGYTEKFGIHYINFTSPKKDRVPKKSAQFFKDFMLTRSFEI